MSDAGELNGRVDLVPGDDRPVPAGSDPAPGGLSKRAARRRRKRKPPAQAGAPAEAERGAAPVVRDRISAETVDRTTRGEARPRKRSKKNGAGREARGRETARPAGSLAVRGLRQAQHGAKPGARGEQRSGGPRPSAPRPGQADARQPDRRGGEVVAPAAGVGERSPEPRDGRAPEGRRASRRGEGGPLYAALDLGTNNCRLLVAEPQERGFRVVDAFSRIVRLGEGIGRSGRLSEAAMDRAVEALAICRHKMQELDVRRMRLIATEACRAAENGPIFLERVRAETGLTLEIVNRETEARLAVAGCATLVDPRAEGVVLFDIGGGSSELVWLDLRNRGEARGFALTRFIKAWTSLPVGVVTLSERHGGVTVTPEVFARMVDEVDAMIGDFDAGGELAGLVAGGRVHMLGTSGTVTTLAGIHLGLRRYDRRRVDGVWLEAIDVDQMVARLVGMGFEERVANPCIGSDRADLVLAGCAILEAIRRRWPCERLRVADRGLREGILVELMARDGVWRRRGKGPRPRTEA